MALQIPKLKDLFNQILTDLEGELGTSIPRFGKNYLRASAGVQAAKMKLYYLTIARVQKNIFVDTADSEAIGGTLERFGRVKLGRDPFPATAAKYTVQVTGSIGAVVSAGTTFKSNDDSRNPGKLFVLDVEKTLASETDSMQLRSLETGVENRLDAPPPTGNQLTSTSPIANVDKIVTVLTEDLIPQAAEDLEEYRQKAIDAYQLEAQGGAATDYRLWSADAQGVLRVYPFAKSGADWDINVFVEATEIDSTDQKGTPTAAILTEVEEVIEFDPDTTKELNDRGRRPLDVIVDVQPIKALDVDLEYIGFTNLTPELETVVEAALKEFFKTVRPFVAAADIIANKNDVLTAGKIIAITQSVLPDAVFFETVNFLVDGNPISTSFTFLNGDIPFLNNITF